jgi:hypothetical protein
MTDDLTTNVLGFYYPLNRGRDSGLSSIEDYRKLVGGTLLSLRGVDRFFRGPKTTLYFRNEPGVSLEWTVSNGYGRTVEVKLVEKHKGKPQKLEEAVTSLIKSKAGLPQAVSEFDDYEFAHRLIERNGGDLSHAIKVLAGKPMIVIRPIVDEK